MRHACLAALLLVVGGCGTPAPIRIGSEAPDFEAVDIASGDTISFREEYGGDVTLVNVWATWCDPCKEEIPALDSMYRQLAPRGFRIAAVSVDTDDSSRVREFIEHYNVAFDVLHDQRGRIQQVFQTTGVPESFLIDRSGRILRIVYGAHPWTSGANRRIVEELLAAPPAPGP
jgi:peroxiredoxin